MPSAVDYMLKAENYAIAALTAETMELRARCVRAAAIYRNKALRLQLGARAHVLRRCPFTRDELKAM